MTEELWDQVLEINLLSEMRIDEELLGRELVKENGRIVCVSSISGIAGNAGQANYATSKAGVIGMVGAMHELLGAEGRTINAVAPGFIETAMTAAMPIPLREAGRRMNSLSQGGLPSTSPRRSPGTRARPRRRQRQRGPRLRPEPAGRVSSRVLAGPPSTLGLYARAGLGSIPGVSSLPLVGGRAKDVPGDELVLEDVEIDLDRLAAYAGVCGFRLRDELPPTYPHILAFPLHMALMTDRRFPFPAIGLVHIGNRITQHRPIGIGEALRISVRASKLEPHPKGRQFSLITEARAGDELVWDSASTNLRRGGEEIPRTAARNSRKGSRGRCGSPPSGSSTTASAAATPRSPAIATRSTCTA